MRKPTICICENKDADQFHGNQEAYQRFCFRYTDSTLPPLLKLLACFCDYSLIWVGPVRKPHCWFSHETAHIIKGMHASELTLPPHPPVLKNMR